MKSTKYKPLNIYIVNKWDTLCSKSILIETVKISYKISILFCCALLCFGYSRKLQQRINHYNDVIMSLIASQITNLTVVCSTVYSDADQRKHQSSVWMAFVWGIHRDRWIPRTKGQLRGKCFHLMMSSCKGPFWKLGKLLCYHVTLSSH